VKQKPRRASYLLLKQHLLKARRNRDKGLEKAKELIVNVSTYEEGGRAMGMLRIISSRGDDRISWNEQDALSGDAEALAAVREAERIFARAQARGATAFRVEAGKPPERLEQFDMQATQIVMVPRVVGG
jgi:hypothetical protein